MIETTAGAQLDCAVLHNYLKALVNRFFKILPIREQNEESLVTYMRSLQSELLGFKELVISIRNDAEYLTLVSILQYLIDHPECSVKEVRREVFHAISICNKLQSVYAAGGELR